MPESSTCLELTISIPGLSPSPSPSLPSSELKTINEGEGGGVIIRDLDINQIPSGGEEDCMEEDEDDECPNGGGGPPRKKLRLTKEQSRLLEESFRQNHTLNPKQKEVLAMQLKLKQRQVEVWFQNRRARSKLKQTEMECEYLKRWFSSLTEQNRRLKKEVEELRAMKVTSQNCKPLPASTLTMCPRCERVTAIVVQDNGGPTTTSTTASTASTTTSVGPTLSDKAGPFFQTRRHPSAAC